MKRPSVVAAAVTLVAAAVIVYHNALSAYFFDDDFQWLVGSWSFHPSQLVALGTLTHFYRPVIDVYFAAATPLFGGSPVLFHLASILLHAANGLVIFALARQISRSVLYGFLTALFFVVQPSDIDAIAWVGALAEAVAAFFGCLSVWFFLKWLEERRARWRGLSVILFLLALLTHESSVIFLPLLALAAWAAGSWQLAVGSGQPAGGQRAAGSGQGIDGGWRAAARREGAGIARVYAPYLVLTIAYLMVDLWINSRNYVVSQGHYAIGVHVVRNLLDYIDALYVGRRDALNYAAIAIGLVLLVLRGSRRVRFATWWMLLALAPFLAFNWGNTSRYLYQPAIGFSMLVAEGVLYLDRVSRPRVPWLARFAMVAALTAGITLRFALFAMANVASFTERTQTYRSYTARFREIHGAVPSHTTVTLDSRLAVKLPYQFVNAAVQWSYGDPTIQIEPYEYTP